MSSEAVAQTSAKQCLIIAEVAQAHDGSLGTAHAFIDAVAKTGAHAIKFQTHLAAAESSHQEPWRVKFSKQDATRYDYWKRMEFSEPQWVGLQQHCAEKGLQFISSPFSLEAAELLSRVGVRRWKMASGEINNLPLLDYMIATKLPLLISTGMSPLSEIDGVVERVKSAGNPLTVMQCTSSYPCPPEAVGLNMIPVLRERYGCQVGLSDHSGTIYPGLAAATLGSEVIEVHVTLSREMFGPDVTSSLTTTELKELVDGVQFIERMRNSPVDKDKAAGEMAPMRKLFTKSLAAAKNLPAGSVVEETDLVLRKPGTGIPAEKLASITGRMLLRPIAQGDLLSLLDFETGPELTH